MEVEDDYVEVPILRLKIACVASVSARVQGEKKERWGRGRGKKELWTDLSSVCAKVHEISKLYWEIEQWRLGKYIFIGNLAACIVKNVSTRAEEQPLCKTYSRQSELFRTNHLGFRRSPGGRRDKATQ